MTVLIHTAEVVLKRETLTLCFLQGNTDDGLRRGSITGTGILHHVHILNLVGTKSREFLHILHPSPVDIHLGIAAPNHLHGSVALCL